MKTGTFHTNSPEETKELGRQVGSELNRGDVLALVGNLGSGKTVFVQGIAEGLGIKGHVRSPSFTIVNEYHGNIPLYHIDLYRLGNTDELTAIGIEDYFYTDGVTVIEWAETALDLLPPRYTLIRFFYTGENIRRIEILSDG